MKYTLIDGFLFTGFLSSQSVPAFAFPMTGLVGFEWTTGAILTPIPASQEKVNFFLYYALVRANKSLEQRETHDYPSNTALVRRPARRRYHSSEGRRAVSYVFWGPGGCAVLRGARGVVGRR